MLISQVKDVTWQMLVVSVTKISKLFPALHTNKTLKIAIYRINIAKYTQFLTSFVFINFDLQTYLAKKI